MFGSKKKTSKKIKHVQVFSCHEVLLTLPREVVARTKVLTRNKRVLPDGYDEAIKMFEKNLNALASGERLTPGIWFGRGTLKTQADLKAAAAVLLSFGISSYPVPADQEAAARALAIPVTDAKTESDTTPEPSEA